MLEDLLKGEFMAQGEPFYNKTDSELGIVMFHGLTATPYQVRELGDFLYSKGIANFGARIAGHSTQKSDLAKTTREEWLRSSRNAYEEFHKVHPKTIVLGFSLGGLLALNVANEYKPKGLITLATPYKLNMKGNFLSMIGFHKKHPDDMISYPGSIPFKSKYELIKLIKETHEAIEGVECPILIVQGTADRRVSNDSPRKIYDQVKSKDKALLILDGEQHIVLKGKYKNQVFDNIYEFILNHQ
ncbi:MAG: alpha/beta hydrolase [Nanoarchaeota archaeon]|nr:alpha/beta hydrolase [Nanoarchaeota archaeon]